MSQPNQSNDGQARLDRIHEIVDDCLVRRTAGEVVADDSIIAAHPDLMPELEEWLHCLQVIGEIDEPAGQNWVSDRHEKLRCPNCDTLVEIGDDTPLEDLTCSSCGSPLSVVSDDASSSTLISQLLDLDSEQLPSHIGRYRIEKMLGKGAFGRVFLAHDEQLGRQVAVKVPHARIASNTDRAAAYLAEARAVANLDHPHIVPIHDVGSTDHFPCYLVCKYVEGRDLATKLKKAGLK